MDGHLFRYDKKLAAMRYGPVWSDKILIHIAGLTDGLMACPWTTDVAVAASEIGWTLVQPILSSSYQGYGVSSLDTDSEELKCLISAIKTFTAVHEITLLGHSTGCQNSVHFTRKYPEESVTRLILQGAVSDREYMETLDTTKGFIKIAKQMVLHNKEDEYLMPREADEAPITATRYLSLADVGGADDMFSTDLSDEMLSSLLSCPVPALVVLSECDEYVPPGYDVTRSAKRLANALGPKSCFFILPTGNHSISDPCDQKLFITQVVSFLQQTP